MFSKRNLKFPSTKPFLLIFLAFLSGISCIKKEKFDKLEFDPQNSGLAMALIDSKLSIGNIIDAIDENNTLMLNPDSSYTFNYYDTIFSPKAEELFILNNRTVNILAPLPSTVPPLIPAGNSVSGQISAKENLVLSDGSQLKSILFKAGQMLINFNTSLRHTISATITIPNMKRNGVSFSKTFTSTFSNGNIISPSAVSENLAGYNLELTGDGSETNKINYTINYTITGSGQPVLSNQGMNISLTFQDMKFKNMIGSLSTNSIIDPFDRNTDIKVFDNALAGTLFLRRSSVTITAENSFGIPLRLDIDKMNATNVYDGTAINFTGITNNGFNVRDGKGSATVSAPRLVDIGKISETVYLLNADNSNIGDIIKPASNELNYIIKPTLLGGNDQFITDESQLKIKVKVSLPIYGILENYELGDTLGIDKFPKRIEDDYTIDSVRFTFKTTNSLPFDTYSQIYFVDSNDVRIDSLLLVPSEFIVRPVIDNNGKAIKATEQTTNVGIGGLRYDKISSKSKYMYIYSRLLTSKDEQGLQRDVQLFYSNSLRIEICALVIGQGKIKPIIFN
jgi:hypothetical protein